MGERPHYIYSNLQTTDDSEVVDAEARSDDVGWNDLSNRGPSQAPIGNDGSKKARHFAPMTNHPILVLDH